MGAFRAHDAIYDLQIPHGLANVDTNVPFSIIMSMNAYVIAIIEPNHALESTKSDSMKYRTRIDEAAAVKFWMGVYEAIRLSLGLLKLR